MPQVGTLSFISVRPEHGAPLATSLSAEVLQGFGIQGDVSSRGKRDGKRQVTLVQLEHLAVIASLTGTSTVRPEQVRRNLAVSGINLLALVKLRFAVGDEVILVGSGACAPCEQMETLIGSGAFQAMRGHGGITATVERGGRIRVGDQVRVLKPATVGHKAVAD